MAGKPGQYPQLPAAQHPLPDAGAPLTCLPDGTTVGASSKAKLVTEGRSPVGFTVAILPVITYLWGRSGEEHPEGTGLGHTKGRVP